MNRKTLVTTAVAGALGLAAVTAPAVASAFGPSHEESTSVVVPGGVVTDVANVDEPAIERSTAVRTTVPTPVASAVPVPPPAAPQEPSDDEDPDEFEAHTAPSPVVPPVIGQDDDQGRSEGDRGRADGPKHVNPEPHSPSDDADYAANGDEDDRRDDDRGDRGDDRQDHDHRHGDDDDRRDDDGWSR